MKNKNKIIICVMLLSCSVNAQKQFTNNGNFISHIGANVSFFGDLVNNASFLDSGTTTNISGLVPQQIGGTSIIKFNNLQINNATGTTLLQPIKVKGSLTLSSGLLVTSATSLLIMTNGSVTTVGTSSSTSYVNGPMIYQKSTAGNSILNFPIGKDVDCRPVALIVNHVNSTLYNYQAESFNTDASALGYTLPITIDTISRVHYWTIDRTDNSGNPQPTADLNGNQTIKIFFGTNDNVKDGNNISICKNSNISPTAWFDIGGINGPAYNAGSNLTGSITSTSSPSTFNSFSTFTLGSGLSGWNPMPIELLNFSAEQDEGEVIVNWSVASETNNHHYIIERSTNAVLFEYVTLIDAHGDGNNVQTQNYSIRDTDPYEGISYYRLKQVDLNGEYTYSSIAAVRFISTSAAQIYPIPSSDKLNIDFAESNQYTKAVLLDISGNEIAYFALHSMHNEIDLSSISSGIYYLVTTSGVDISSENTIKTKIVILK